MNARFTIYDPLSCSTTTEDAFQTICRQLSLDSQSLHTPVREDEAIFVAQINQSLANKTPEALRSFTQSYEQLSNLVSLGERQIN